MGICAGSVYSHSRGRGRPSRDPLGILLGIPSFPGLLQFDPVVILLAVNFPTCLLFGWSALWCFPGVPCYPLPLAWGSLVCACQGSASQLQRATQALPARPRRAPSSLLVTDRPPRACSICLVRPAHGLPLTCRIHRFAASQETAHPPVAPQFAAPLPTQHLDWYIVKSRIRLFNEAQSIKR